MLSNCGHDERGKYSGGKAGDQTGTEWVVIPWYSRPWGVMLRHPNAAVGKKIAELAEKAAKNDYIGYDQGDRYTFWQQLKASGYDPAKIAVACEADCSSGVAALVKAVGYLMQDKKLQGVSIHCYTGNLRAALVKAGFDTYTEKEYLNGDSYLLPGDILLLEGHHVAVNLTAGKNAPDSGLLTGWRKSSDGKYMYFSGGVGLKNCWGLINHHWYLFGTDGYMLTGWHRWDGYNADPEGNTGDWYYLDETAGGVLEGACWHSRDNGSMEIWYVE